MKIGVMRHVRVAWLGGAMLALSACGGGGGGGGGQAPTPQPTITLSAAQTLVQEGQATELTWSSTNAAGCTASGGWSGALAVSGTQSTGPLTATSTYTLACTGPGGTNQTSVVVTVQPIPSSVEIEATPRILRGAQTSQLF